MLSLTPTMCRSLSGSFLSPSFRKASNSLLAGQSGLQSRARSIPIFIFCQYRMRWDMIDCHMWPVGFNKN